MSELWEHQKEGVRRALLSGGRFGFFYEMGVGKSATTIHTCRNLFNKHEKILKTLIVSPLITLDNWQNEWVKFSKVTKEQVLVLKGSGSSKAEKMVSNTRPIVVVNYEALLSDKLLKAIAAWGPDILILDESQRVKNPTSKRTKACHALSKIAAYRFILSGTPILKNLMDVWSQMFVLDHGAALGDSFYRFKLRYFFDKNAGMPKQSYFPEWVVRKDMIPHIEKVLNTQTMSVKKSECLDLPPYIRQTIFVDIEGEQKRHYLNMKELFISYMNDNACVASIALTKTLRMLQILSGHMPLDNGEVVTFKDTPRAKALEELLSDIAPNHKVIVWATFKEDFKIVRKICDELKIGYRELHGEVKQKDRDNFMDEFNTDESVRVLIANPQAAGVGVNLVSASYSIYYSRSYSLEADLQSEARNYRAGSERHEKITRIDLVAKDTLDEVVLKALQDKKEIGESVLRAWANDSK